MLQEVGTSRSARQPVGGSLIKVATKTSSRDRQTGMPACLAVANGRARAHAGGGLASYQSA